MRSSDAFSNRGLALLGMTAALGLPQSAMAFGGESTLVAMGIALLLPIPALYLVFRHWYPVAAWTLVLWTLATLALTREDEIYRYLDTSGRGGHISISILLAPYMALLLEIASYLWRRLLIPIWRRIEP